MRRPRTAVISPDYFDSGEIGRQTAGDDEYFSSLEESTLKIVIDHFIQRLPDLHRAAVEMCIMQNVTYADAAEILSVQRGVRTDPKTVWRWAQKGVAQLAEMFDNAKWTASLEPRMKGQP